MTVTENAVLCIISMVNVSQGVLKRGSVTLWLDVVRIARITVTVTFNTNKRSHRAFTEESSAGAIPHFGGLAALGTRGKDPSSLGRAWSEEMSA
ncbi:MAG: hypothetical protein ACI3ZT_01200 [Candidatus Cryptobacteroides sp.]